MPNAIDFYTLISIGIVLVALEVFLYSFFVIWFGLGFIVVAFISIFFDFSDLYIQIGTISVFSLLFLLFFRKIFLKRFSKAQKELSDNFFNEKGFGVFKEQKIFYKGTFWELDPNFDKTNLKSGEKVKVIKIDKNVAFVEKI